MECILRKMTETIGKYAEVLSQVLKVDVEIVDETLYRIAGTGRFEGKANLNMSDEGYVYKEVIASGEMKIVEDPGKNELCSACPRKGVCEETYEMCMPVKLNGRVIGVIGLVCFTQSQRNHIIENYKTFVEFLQQISGLISSKALEEMEAERNVAIIELLNNIVDKIDEGVLVIDNNQHIVKMNFTAKNILEGHVTAGSIVEITETGEQLLEQKQYILRAGQQQYDVVGKYFSMDIDQYHTIFIFKDSSIIRDNALTLAVAKEKIGLGRILGESLQINELKKNIKRVASSASTVLITGESGTGKELFARALHEESERASNPFIAINCAAIPDNLLESELFGYVKGAFTGADPKGKIGKFELAHKGTLFLDEVGDMPLYIQVKLLRALEQKEIVRLGSNEPIKIDARVVAATNKNLEQLIVNNSFREDLYYRLNVIPMQIPPLRDRKGDIRLLTSYFINRFSGLFSKRVVRIDESLWTAVEAYPWPGNIRELQNAIEYAINMMGSEGIISPGLLPGNIKSAAVNPASDEMNLERLEKKIMAKAIELYGSDGEAKKTIARELGIGIATLYRKMRKYGLE